MHLVHDVSIKTIMNAKDLTTIDQLTAFLGGTQRVAFEVTIDKDSRYQKLRIEFTKPRSRQTNDNALV